MLYKLHTEKLFTFIGTEFQGLTTMDMFVDTGTHGFQIICNITKVKSILFVILNLWIALPTNKQLN